jgi:hypothetical protein
VERISSAGALTDTSTFTRDVLRSFAQGIARENPFTLAIAGYGTGKSHLGLTLATLFSEPHGAESKRVLENIRSVEKPLAEEIRHELQHHEKPFLVLAINGMEDFDLASKVTELLLLRLCALKHDTARQHGAAASGAGRGSMAALGRASNPARRRPARSLRNFRRRL